MSPRKRDDGRRGRRRNLAVVAASTAVVVGMAGLVYASPLLYRWFCQATGFGGTPRIAAAAPGRAEPAQTADRVITVRFNADVNGALPWRFRPARRSVEVKLGEETLAFYHAANLAGEAVTGTATFNVTPAKSARGSRRPGTGRMPARPARTDSQAQPAAKAAALAARAFIAL